MLRLALVLILFVGATMARAESILGTMAPPGRDVRSNDPRVAGEEEHLRQQFVDAVLARDSQAANTIHKQLREKYGWGEWRVPSWVQRPGQPAPAPAARSLFKEPVAE